MIQLKFWKILLCRKTKGEGRRNTFGFIVYTFVVQKNYNLF